MSTRRHFLALTTLVVVALTGCSGPTDSRRALQSDCLAKGGAHFEYESTSAGAHIWCITADGREIEVGP